MGRIAVLFPGQGVQKVGMGRDLLEAYPEVRALFTTAGEVIGRDLLQLCLSGPEDALTVTYHAQPAILTVCIAYWHVLRSYTTLTPDFVAGHSLGEYTALVAADALRFEDGVRLVYYRGRYMQEAVPVGTGTMAAVIGLGEDTVARICASIARPEYWVGPANWNAPDQIVIAGHTAAVREAAEQCRAAGARRVVFLQVSAPFHTPLVRPAEERLAAHIDAVGWQPLRIPWMNNVTAEPVTDPETARAILKRQMTAPVQWTRLIRRLRELGVTTFVEVGPGRVLTGLVRRIVQDAECMAIHHVAALQDAMQRWPKTE